MNKIQQYRKVSAKKIGLKLEDHELLGKVYRNYKTQFIVPIDDWKPDLKENADQREMIEDWLIEQGCKICYETDSDSTGVDIVPPESLGYICYESFAEDKSKPIAFMKAFLTYVESIK